MPVDKKDTFFNGALVVSQPEDGYRYSIDAILLAGQPRPKPGDCIVDLGCGCGIIAIILAHRHPAVRLHAVEIQPALAWHTRRNAVVNHLRDRLQVHEKDIQHLRENDLGGPVDWIVSNPPYHRVDSGRLNPDAQKALARHEIHLNLETLMHTVRRLLRTGGRFCTIYPAERTVDLLWAMRHKGIEPKRLQQVHSREGEPSRLVLVEGMNGGRPGLSVAPPIVIYDSAGNYTDAVQTLMRPSLPPDAARS